MMIKILALFCFVGLLGAEIISTTSSKTASGEGIGATREAAINNAIIEALGKMSGVNIKSEKFIDNSSNQSSSGSEYGFKFDEKIKNVTNGNADSYSIDSIMQNSDGKWEAVVTITNTKTTKSYKTPGLDPNSRRKLAIISGYSKNAYVQIDEQNVYSQVVADDITNRLVSAFTKTRKFTILDRNADDAYTKEAALIASQVAAKDEALKLGQVLGADYLLVFRLDDFNIDKVKSMQITASDLVKKQAKVKIHFRVIAMATRQVKYSNELILSLKSKDAYEDAILSAANSISDEVVNAIYPLKVASVNAGELVVTQPLKVGVVYDVYAPSKEKIKDPYTGELVGYAQSKTAQASVVRADNKLSYLKLISGSAKAGDFLRVAGDGDVNGKSSSQVKQTSDGGVVLPF